MTYIPGDNWAICPICGFKVRASKMKRRWDGIWACLDRCWEPRHPQDFVKSKPDFSRVVVNAPEPEDTFLSTSDNSSPPD